MKLKEKLAEEYCSYEFDIEWSLTEIKEFVYLAGFDKARKMATELTASYGAPPETLKEYMDLGDEEVE